MATLARLGWTFQDLEVNKAMIYSWQGKIFDLIQPFHYIRISEVLIVTSTSSPALINGD